MIEIEKKFILTEKQKEKLLDGAEFLGEKVFTDTYYDNAQFSLGLNDMWMRQREGEFELKIPMPRKENQMINKYHEIEGEMAIREIFAVPVRKSFIEDIAELGHFPFCSFITTRKKYKKDGFAIDLDVAEFGDLPAGRKGWQYQLCEIELMVEEENKMDEAEEKIYAFAKKHGLEIKHVNGKLMEYLNRKKPKIYAQLLRAGIIKE